jgi:pyrimidine deaminase RibD-like protein
MSNEHHMRRAIALSMQMMRSNRGGPFGAVIVKDGKVIAEGANEVISTNDPTAHAEITAMRRACQALQTFDLHDAARVGFRDDQLYREIPLPPAQRAIPAQPLLRVEGKAVFDEWLRKPDKVEY